MTRRTVALGAAAVAAMLAVTPAVAHHSFAAEYDRTQTVKLTGAVTKIDWQNPHVYFYIDVRDESGRVANWALEMGAPAVLARTGWRKSTMKIGDLVVVEAYRAKAGGTHGNARTVTMASTGERLGAGSSAGDGDAR